MNDQPPPPPMMMNPVQPQMMNQTHPMMLNRYNNNNPWQLQDHPNPNNMKFPLYPSKPRTKPNAWKGKNVKTSEYNPPSLNDLQTQNRMKARKYYHPKHKKFNNNNNNNNRYIPYAPRNTTSFIIRAKKSGGIASLVSPCPVTPAVLPTPIFSPSREVLGDMAKEEWGVDGYGSMKGLIRLRPQNDEDDDEEGNGSSESDVEEHVEVERRLDHDLSRFEMIYPSYEYNNVLENRVDDQDTHIAQLEEENLTLKERLFLMEREVGELRRRLGFLERRGCGGGGESSSMVGEEVVENGSENDENESDGGSDVRMEENVKNDELDAENVGSGDVSMKRGSGFAANCGIAVDGKDVVVVKEGEELENRILGGKVVLKENVGGCDVDTKRGSGFVTNGEIAVADEVKDVVMAKEGVVNVEELRIGSGEVKVVSKEEILKNDGNCDDIVMERIVEDELEGKNDGTDH